MKVRIVCSATSQNFNFSVHQAFIYDQTEAIKAAHPEVEFSYFFIRNGGLKGYLNAYFQLRKAIREEPCSMMHAHVALSGFICSLQFREPFICTFHGSDINKKFTRRLSAWVAFRSKVNVFVSNKLLSKSYYKKRAVVIPCGVDTEVFHPMDKTSCRKKLGLNPDGTYLLFSSAFDNPVKNFPLLQEALSLWEGTPPQVLELKGISRKDVPVWMNAADVCVLTSFSEGSSQFLKEALACNRPVISTPVGDASTLFEQVSNAKITTFAPAALKQDLLELLKTEASNGRECISAYDQKMITQKIYDLYNAISLF